MIVVPVVVPVVARPALFIVATAVFDENHVTDDVKSNVVVAPLIK